jgi:hypothetical protein
MSPLTVTVPRAENEGDALLVVSPLRLHHSTRRRYTSKTSQGLVYVHFQLFSLELHPWTLNGAIKCVVCIFSSKMCCLSDGACGLRLRLLCALMEKSGPQQFVGHQRSITEIVLEKAKSLVEAALQNFKFVVPWPRHYNRPSCIPSLAVVQCFDVANRTIPQHHQDDDRLAYTRPSSLR